MRRLAPVFALAALAAGCGSSGVSEAEYERSVQQASQRADAALAHITNDPSGREELLLRMDEAALEIDETAEDLSRAGSPEKFEDETTELVSSLRQLAVDLSATAEQIRQPDFSGLLEGTQGLSFESWVKVNEALKKLRQQGIEAPPLGRH
ncbi:MAG: hypothetical protein WD689_09960 [Gaiellaceae bacterium]